MFYIDKETQTYPLSEADIQERHPRVLMAHCLEQYAPVQPAPIPEHDSETHKPVQIEPRVVEGVWHQQWEIVPLSETELADVARARALAEKEALEAARTRVTKRQALLALYDLKEIREDAILAAINAIENEHARYRTLVDWQGAATVESDSPTVLLLAGALNITADLPALFAYAEAM
jgi:hypothetical protein